ncbi:MAG TPA: PilZ domain-containing protein [Terriglobales bacterium]|nr:PilZ domain-containing protein [Terriglobales bacterium]
MEHLSATSSAPESPLLSPRPRRRHYRQRVQNLAYVRLDQANGGILRDLSESGIAIQAVAPLRVDQQVLLRFELLNPRTRIEARGRVAWADPLGQAGLEFLDIAAPPKHLLKEWIFTQLMATAQHAERAESVFIHHKAGENAMQLVLSGGARPPIQLQPEESELLEETTDSLPLLGSPLALSEKSLSRTVDCLLLLCAVLLFAIIALGITNLFPTWPLAVALALGITSAFAAIYWYLFAVCVGMTPGEQLARIAFSASEEPEVEERFR